MRVVTRGYVLPNGEQADWDLVDGGQTVAVLALRTDGRVVLARQFRPGPGVVLDEMPGGYVEAHEHPAAAAERELLEETGYAGQIDVVGSSWLSASATTRRYVAIARDCTQRQAPAPEAGEFIELVDVSLAEFRNRLRAGAMTDVDLGYLALDHLGLL